MTQFRELPLGAWFKLAAKPKGPTYKKTHDKPNDVNALNLADNQPVWVLAGQTVHQVETAQLGLFGEFNQAKAEFTQAVEAAANAK